MQRYNTKMVISGKYVDIYEYDRLVVVDFNRDVRLRSLHKEISKKEKSKSSIHRTKKNIKNITNANPQLQKFLTLTFAENVIDIEIKQDWVKILINGNTHYEGKPTKLKLINKV